jgi:hypothetical protein
MCEEFNIEFVTIIILLIFVFCFKNLLWYNWMSYFWWCKMRWRL